MPKPKAATSYKLPQDAKDLLDALHVQLGTPKTYLLADAIRAYAKRRGVTADSSAASDGGKIPEKTRKTT